jgi:hypothetical protein
LTISEVIIEYDLDILHMHYAVPHAVCGILARQMSGKDIKIMTTLHGTDITGIISLSVSIIDCVCLANE